MAAAAARRPRCRTATSDALPDFVKLAEAYGCVGIRAEKPHELDDKIDGDDRAVQRPVLFDCRVAAARRTASR